ncbi:hypothetical protein AUC61_13730 [Pseudomonas sp. S25]|uniref:Uncharacterized protein n=1 Tax=Pseudomonas maioricensis TaxID=1766623 RepID=A0ABS9ZJ38_9PSED|nr:hypothetical protein [Pseudomonas sp. S25]MCI8210596.1 hypothetical protein [Pseudomonas sp. S25]
MAQNVGDLSRGPCCEINKLIVQVVGNEHPASQRLAFYECDSDKRLDALTAQDCPETITAFMCTPSMLHVWDWSDGSRNRMMLEVESESGSPILLPLPDVGITVRQLDQQHNQIVPILPFVALPGINSAHDYGTPVLCRPGYIYVFLGNRLWRELEVQVTDEGTTYHDIDLNKFRIEGGYADDARLATGKGLDDIWLPANWNNKRVEAELCFSEVQLNPARLKRLEQDPGLRKQRCQRPDLRVAQEASSRRFQGKPDGAAMLKAFSAFDAFDAVNQSEAGAAHTSWLNLRQHAFPVSVPAPQRARQTGFEWMLDQPAQYLCDLGGRFLATAFKAARQHVQRCEDGKAAYLPQRLETGAWAQRLAQLVEPTAESNSGLWEAHPPAEDVLSRARSRHLYGVMLVDAHYRMRHLNTRIQEQQQLLELCGARAQQYGHHGSALLVQQLIVPASIGGQKNPMHQQLEHLKEQGRLDINRFTATGERTQLWRSLEMSQSLLCECLQQLHTEQSLADYASQDGFKYAASLYFISQMFVTLALRPAAYDPLAVSGDITDAVTQLSLYSPKESAGQRWLAKVVNDLEHPLHRMLWPDAELQDLNAPYQPPSAPEVNQGDGQFRGTELAKIERSNFFPPASPGDINSLFLATLLKSGNLNSTLTTAAKGAAGALIAVHENLQGAVEAAEQALHKAKQAGARQSSTPWRASTAIQRRGIAQLRSMLPDTFGDLHFLSRAEAHHKEYHVFGLDDLPEQPNRSAHTYGVYRNQHGAMKSPAERHGYAEQPVILSPDRSVLGTPGQHPTSISVRDANLRFNEAWQKELMDSAADTAEKASAIEKAAKQLNGLRHNGFFEVLNSAPFAAGVVGLELWNLRNELDAQEQVGREKSHFRASAGISGASLDLAIAMEALTVKLAGSQSILAAARTTLFTLSEASAERLLGPLSAYLVKALSARLLGQVGAGLVFAGLNLYDAWYSYRWGDDGYVGHLLMAAGGLIGAAGSLIVSSSAFLGLSPAGWACLLLIGMGAAWVFLFSSSPVEDWLKKGPFGGDPYNMAEHLRDPQTAFYYLVSLLANIRIGVERNPDFEPDAKLDFRDTVPFEVRSANTRIRIESNLSGLFGGPSSLNTKALLNLKSFEVYFEASSERSRTNSSQLDVTPVAHRLWPDALELFVNTPFSYKAEPLANLPEVYHVWRVRAQFSLNDGQRIWVFPAPPPKDPTPFDPAYSKPDFESIERLFWADEKTHRAKTSL